jgi:hypothetical protein
MVNDIIETLTPVGLIALFVGLVITYCTCFGQAYSDCERKGGVLVQGIIWYECVVSAEEQ